MMLMKTEKLYHFSLEILLILIVLYTFEISLEHYVKQNGTLYILLWTGRSCVPCSYWELAQKSFTMMGCKYKNCYIVEDIDFFKDMTDYDVILFNSIDTNYQTELPNVRSDNQIYVFLSTESSINYPKYDKFNWFFNYTWTYKMNSDIYYPYFVTRNKRGAVIAPKIDVKWLDIKDMKPATDLITDKLDNKKVAAAWFVTYCQPDQRLNYLIKLRAALKKYGHSIDVFGACQANKQCVDNSTDDCFALLESDYYFYLSFENYFAEDYVTDILMTALDHYTVPVVLGGANYSKFMPDGIYLNANYLTEDEAAKEMADAISDKEKYYNFFNWHQHYSYHIVSESADTDPLCNFCAFLNDEYNKNQRRVYARFTMWWQGFEEEFDATGDIIVYYNNQSVHKTIFKSYRNDTMEGSGIGTVTRDETSFLETVGEIAGKIFHYYFD